MNPYHGDAKFNDIAKQISESQSTDELISIRSQAQRLASIAPTDARAYSLVGETYLRSQETDEAKGYYETALRFSKTEITALQRSYGFMLEDGQISEAIDRFDLISTRWPSQFDLLVPTLPYILNSEDGYEKVLTLLADHPPWRPQFLAVLNENPDTLSLSSRVLLDLNAIEGRSHLWEIEVALNALVRAKRYGFAHRLFLFTQSESDRDNNGYVFNSAFNLEPSNRPFDWRIRDTAAAQIRWIADGLDGSGQLRVRFLGKPAKHLVVQQLVRLPPGLYELIADYSGAGLQLPKGLFLKIRCINPGHDVAGIEIPQANAVNQTLSSSFQVDPDSCGLFQIGLFTDLIAESFRYRYKGTLVLHDLRIERRFDE